VFFEEITGSLWAVLFQSPITAVSRAAAVAGTTKGTRCEGNATMSGRRSMLCPCEMPTWRRTACCTRGKRPPGFRGRRAALASIRTLGRWL
jgi:hypothetical protein